MSYPFGPNIVPYGPPPNQAARRAGMLILALGCIALLIGLLCVLMAVLSPEMAKNPEYAARLEDLRRQTQIDPVILIGVMAGMFIGYAVAAIPLGLLCRRGRLPWLIATLVFVICAGLFMGVSALANVLGNNAAGALIPALLTALHGLAAGWLIGALRSHATLPPAYRAPLTPQSTALPPQPQSFTLPAPPQPMQDYYLPIPPPPTPRQPNQ